MKPHKAHERTRHHLNRVDPLDVDWVSREALLSEYETNHRQ